jgi:hypothetical protein
MSLEFSVCDHYELWTAREKQSLSLESSREGTIKWKYV